MSGTSQIEKSIGEQVAELLRSDPQNYDVIFSVGPQKEEVKAVKIFLKAASPVFKKKFDNNWDHALAREGEEGIPLPNFEPDVFKLFVHLYTWSVDALKNLNIPSNTILSLLGLCRHFKIMKAIENLEESADDFLKNFAKFKDTLEFLKMSREHLETVLSCEQLPLDEKQLFQTVCRWAEHQCQQKGIQSTGENFREVLGSCLREIRFPTIKLDEFAQISSFKQNLLTAEETVAIFQFIGADKDQKAKFDKSQLPFKTKPRCSHSDSFSVLCLNLKITQNPPFVCNGTTRTFLFQMNKKIVLHGVGFLGPIDGDTHFDVTVQIKKYVSPSYTYGSGTFKNNILARKGNIFHFLFDAPITLQPIAIKRSWDTRYEMYYSLKGADNVSQFKVENPNVETVQISSVKFKLGSSWSTGSPLAELLFKQI